MLPVMKKQKNVLAWAYVFILMMCHTYEASAQETKSRVDARLGLGPAFLGTGDIRIYAFEGEVNYRLNQYFALGGSLGYAQSRQGTFRSNPYEETSYLQSNVNFYISPFTNQRKNDFRVGVGTSYYSVSDVILAGYGYKGGSVLQTDLIDDKRQSFGVNVILENSYSITERFILGLKVFQQHFQNGDINSGIMMKWGITLNRRIQ